VHQGWVYTSSCTYSVLGARRGKRKQLRIYSEILLPLKISISATQLVPQQHVVAGSARAPFAKTENQIKYANYILSDSKFNLSPHQQVPICTRVQCGNHDDQLKTYI